MFNVHTETTHGLLEGGGGLPINSLSLLSDQHRPKRQSAKTRTINIKKVVTLPVGSNLCIPQLALPTAVRNKVAKTVESREATVEE